jgi:hypothetical protein
MCLRMAVTRRLHALISSHISCFLGYFCLFLGICLSKMHLNQKLIKFAIWVLSSKTNANTVELVRSIFFVTRGVRYVPGATS